MVKHTTILKQLSEESCPKKRYEEAKRQRAFVFDGIVRASGKRFKLLKGYFDTFTQIMEESEKEMAES